MATIGFTIPSGIFPAGASVSAYPASAWPGSQWPPVDTPTGSATQTKTAAGNGSVAFDALAEQTRYVAWDGTHATRFSSGSVAAVATSSVVAADATATPTGSAVSTGLWLPGSTPLSAPRRSAISTIFASGHGYAKSGSSSAGSAVADDTSVFAKGSQSLKLTTDAAGGQCAARKTGATAQSVTGNNVVLMVRVDRPDLLSSLTLYASSDSFTNFAVASIITTNSLAPYSVLVANEWRIITLSPGAFSAVTGSPNMAAITGWQVRAVDNNTGTPVNVWVQEVAITPQPATAVVTWSFDDGYSSALLKAAPYMDKYGYAGSISAIVDRVGQATYCTLAQLQALQNQHGWEVCPHAFTVANHNQWNTLTQAVMESEMLQTKAWLRANGLVGTDTWVEPLGRNTTAGDAVAKKYFSMKAATDGQTRETYPPADPYRVRRMSTAGGVNAIGVVQAAIDTAVTNKEWLILETHNVVDAYVLNDGTETLTASMQTIADYLNTKGCIVKTLGDVRRSGVA